LGGRPGRGWGDALDWSRRRAFPKIGGTTDPAARRRATPERQYVATPSESGSHRPGTAALAWLYLVSGFAVVSGILHMAGAIQLRKQFAGEWVLILNGALTTSFGILMILLPLAGLLSLIWLLGAYSVFFGALLLAVALRLRARWRATEAAAARPA